jgi:hypothetical protein
MPRDQGAGAERTAPMRLRIDRMQAETDRNKRRLDIVD